MQTFNIVASTEKLASNRFVGLVVAHVVTKHDSGFTSTNSIELARLFPFSSDDTARKYAKEEAEVWKRRKWFKLNDLSNWIRGLDPKP